MSMPAQKPGRSKQDYGTPFDLKSAIEARWGTFDIDLAANDDGSNAKAPHWIGKSDNYFKMDLRSIRESEDTLCWCNPPFANIPKWASKWVEDADKGAKIIALVPASIGSEWFATYVEYRAKVIPLRPRICFQGCHQLFPSDHPMAGEPKCGGDEHCNGCATYPKDCMLLLYGFYSNSQLSHNYMGPSWRWK